MTIALDSFSALESAAREFGVAASELRPNVRRTARRAAAENLHRALTDGPVVPAVRTLPLVEGPFPTRLAFGTTVRTIVPFVLVRQRALLVQFFAKGALKTLLWNPTNARLALRVGAFDSLRRGIGRAIAGATLELYPSIDAQMGALGLIADGVDTIACDQLDGQDPSGMLARFPRARIAITEAEWARYSLRGMRDRAFLIPGAEIDRHRVDVVQGARALGEGVVLVQTGGRREGHQALVVRSALGTLVASGNSITLDGYAPHVSKLPGLASGARRRERAVVGAFPMFGDASDAMQIEATLADRLPETPVLPFILPSVEVLPSLIAPGIKPIALAPDLSLGTLMRSHRVPRDFSA